MAGNLIHIGIVSQSRLFRESLLSSLNSESNLIATLLGATWKATDPSLRTDLILVQHIFSLTDVLKSLATALHSNRVIVIDTLPEELDVLCCIQLGVAGFSLRDAAIKDIVRAIHSVVNDRPIIPDCIMEKLCRQLRSMSTHTLHEVPAFPSSDLTLRERQISSLIVEGLSNKEIADRLNISLCTVKTHVHKVLGKLQLQRRVDLFHRFRVDNRRTIDSVDIPGSAAIQTAFPV